MNHKCLLAHVTTTISASSLAHVSGETSTAELPNSVNDQPVAIHKGKRTYIWCLISNFVSYSNPFSFRSFVSFLDLYSVPMNVPEALFILGQTQVMQEEMTACRARWYPEFGMKTVGCKWRYIVKLNLDGSLATLKA